MSGYLTGIITTNGNFPSRAEVMTKVRDLYGNNVGSFISISEISEDDYKSTGGSF
jgi:hypothetical protein